MTYSENLYFTFNGISSSMYNLLNVHIQPGMFEETFLPTRTLKEIKIRGRSNPYLQEIEESPRVINVSFAFNDSWNDATMREIVNWLRTDYYKPLIFHPNPTPDGTESMYYAMVTDSSSIIHNGLKQGYLQIGFRTDGPWKYSPVYLSSTERVYNYFLSPTQPYESYKTISFTNNGDENIRPIIIIEAHSSSAKIINTTNGGQVVRLKGLSGHGEIIEVDCQEEIITSSLEDKYRYNNLSDDSTIDFEFVPGVNTLKICGDFSLQFKWEEKYLVG